MATVKYKRGLSTDLNPTNVPIEDGSLILTTDDAKLYADVPDGGKIVRKLVSSGGTENTLNIENADGTCSIQQKVDAEGGQPLALGKWSFAEGRGNNFQVQYSSKDYVNAQLTIATKSGNPQAYQVRKNAILWIESPDSMGGAWYYVIDDNHSSSHKDSTTLTLDSITRTIYDGDGTSASHIVRTHSWENIDNTWIIEVYMGVAAASDSHIEGNFNNTVWLNSDTKLNELNVSRQHAEGSRTLATGYCAHVEGEGTKATGNISHAEGKNTIAEGATSHTEGDGTQALAANSHAEGENTIASGVNSHAEGGGCIAFGGGSHAGGYGSIADGDKAFAHGFYVNASTNIETPGKAAFGQYNENDPNNVFEVGNGNNSIRKNAISVDYHGNASIGSQPIKRVPYKASKIFTPSQTLSGGQMLIRIGQYADGGVMSTIYNPRLRNLTTGEEIDIAITDNNIVVNSSSTANLKWDLRGGGNNHNGINILSTTIESYKVFEINAGSPAPGWRYLQYCINNMTFNSENTYELSVLSPYAEISEIATLDIYYEMVRQTTIPMEIKGGELLKFSIGKSTNTNKSNAFEILPDGTGKIFRQGNDPDSIVQKGYVDNKLRIYNHAIYIGFTGDNLGSINAYVNIISSNGTIFNTTEMLKNWINTNGARSNGSSAARFYPASGECTGGFISGLLFNGTNLQINGYSGIVNADIVPSDAIIYDTVNLI